MKKTTQVVLVRHAQTQTIINERIHGQTDSPLSHKGLIDSRKTAKFFQGQSFDSFYSSPLGRAMTTAKMIGKSIHLPPTPEDGLMERYYGWIEGKPMKWFDPDLTGPKITIPLIELMLCLSGEHADDFVHRIISTFEKITTQHHGQRILIVLHWGVLSVLTQYLQGKDLSVWRGIGPWVACGISEYHLINGKWKLIYLDKDTHLL